jgi:hypothetical protein
MYLFNVFHKLLMDSMSLTKTMRICPYHPKLAKRQFLNLNLEVTIKFKGIVYEFLKLLLHFRCLSKLLIVLMSFLRVVKR